MEFDSNPLRELLTHWLGDSLVAEWVAASIVIVLVTFVLWLVWRLLDKGRKRIHKSIDNDDATILNGLKVQDQQIFTRREISRFLHKLTNYLWVAIRLLLVLLWLNLVFSQFDWSRDLALYLINQALGVVRMAATAVVNYIPNLFIVVFILIIARMVVHILRAIFEGIRLERISLPGFYPEWAETSFGLSRLLVIALTLVIVFPYLPGSGSPAFQGISIFFGVLLSLGSTSAIANIIAGIVITYTRAIKVGDRVKIADTEGDVVERSAFVTRIRTPKNVEVAIPNSMVMNDHIVNFSAQAKDSGVWLHTTVTIGYDVPWSDVHQLLKEAANRTEDLVDDPEPFVLQTSLDDNYVSYELNASTRVPNRKQRISSNLHAHIQDVFREAKVEILSPAYEARRDGSHLTIPEKAENPETPSGTDKAKAAKNDPGSNTKNDEN